MKRRTIIQAITFLALFMPVISLAGDGADKQLGKVFADGLLTGLRKNVKQNDIAKLQNPLIRSMASDMLNDTYSNEYRVQEYEPYPTVRTTAKELKTNPYNQFENPTGIYFEKDSDIIIILGYTHDEPVKLRIHDFRSHEDSDYELRPGINEIKTTSGGLGYISFYTDNYEDIPPVKAHILGGSVNGYFDKNKNKKSEWKSILENTVCEFLDIKGDYINLLYLVEDLKEHCNDGLALIDVYDRITYYQFDLMGLVKYGRVPKNHMFSRWVKSGFFADGKGAGFDSRGMRNIANPLNARRDGIWAIAHELGHVNQVRPGLKWHGTTEVTNNVYSMYTQYMLAPDLLGLERKVHNDGDGNWLEGGRFNSYLNYGILKGETWLFQKGPDRMKDYETGKGADHFVKLCPIWQLMLYYQFCENAPWHNPDWYKDLAELVRNTDDSGKGSGQLQLQFIKNVCDIVGENLSEFFVKAGMLKPVDINQSDYGWQQHTITQEDCDELVKHLSKYPEPTTPVIYYMSANSLEAYDRRLPVEGRHDEGVNMFAEAGYCIINHDVWKNAAVFETYAGDELIKIALAGSGSNIQATTLARYPEGATRIEAVAWNGERTLVYGNR